MKKLILIFVGIILLSCNKKKEETVPPVKKATTTPIKIHSPNRFLGTYDCIMTGTIDMTNISGNTCYLGHKDVIDTFVCVIRAKSLDPGINWGPNSVVADSIMNNSIGLYLTSDSTFDVNYFIYDSKKCKVGLAMTPDMGKGKVIKDTILFSFNGHVHDSYHTVNSKLNCKMVKQ